MKRNNHPFQADSSSTQQRQRRFSRRNSQKSSRSRSNTSQAVSISKFYVKNLEQKEKSKTISEVFSKALVHTDKWTPPKRHPTPHKTVLEKQLKMGRQQLLHEQSKDLTNLRTEIKNYQAYSKKKNKENQQYKIQNSQLKEQICDLQNELEKQKKKYETLQIKYKELTNKINHKEKMLQYMERQQTPLKKVKNSIFISRMTEFQKERIELNNKIKELELTIEEIKCQNSFSTLKNSRIKNNQIFDESCEIILPQSYCDERHLHKIENQLYIAYEQIKKLHIKLSCENRKYEQQLQKVKKVKDRDYNELKDKFTEYLKKYKQLMKKVTLQIRNGNKTSKSGKSDILSNESLTLSDDEDKMQ